MTNGKDTNAAAKPLGVWIDELKAERDRYKDRAEAAEGAAHTMLKRWEDEIHNEYDGTSMLQGRLSECDDIRATLALIEKEQTDE